MGKRGPEPRPLMDRFLEKVDRDHPSGCWIWNGATKHNGYGKIRTGSRTDGTVKFSAAHRVSFELFKSEIPYGLFVCHKCDNPICVNPDHLFVGTNSDNMRDCVNKGRYVNGNTNKTHCPAGHPYDEENTYYRRQRRYCRACDNARNKKKYHLKKKSATTTVKMEEM